MASAIQKLLHTYAETEKGFRLIQPSGNYANLVRANGNQRQPVQRWFHLKEAYSLDLLQTLLDDWNISSENVNRVLDPFCGSGTTLLAVQKLAHDLQRDDLSAVGIERNPFLRFVANTKVRWRDYDHRRFRQSAAHLLNGAYRPEPQDLPTLSTFKRPEIFSPDLLRNTLSYRNAIAAISDPEAELLLLGYASILEAISGVRKDGRALRIEPNKQRADIIPALTAAWREMEQDLRAAEALFRAIRCEVHTGDGRSLTVDADACPDLSGFDLILYSPPYLNNIDYTEVYKIELWLTGMVDTQDAMRKLRYRTFRSHPSVRFRDPITYRADEQMDVVASVVQELVSALPKDEDLGWRTDLFEGYFDDMYASLRSQFQALTSGGWTFCVVGNSLHGPRDKPELRVPVASDLLIALTAQQVGFDVKAIHVARYLTRRCSDSHFLRESIVVLQRP